MTSAYGQITLSKVEDGKDGTSVTVSKIEYAYQLSTSGTSVPTGNWSPNPVAPTTSQYAWTKTTVTFSDGSKSITYTVGGKTGTNGTSVTVSSTEYAYQKSTSGTTVPTGAWSSTPVEPTQTEYVWTRTIVTFSNGSKATTYTVGGKTGQTGPQGKGISSIVTQYYLSTSNTSQSGGGWNTTPAAYVNGRYYWRRDHITWSDSTTSDTTAVLDNALTTANKNAYDAQYAVDNMEVGGRNLFLHSAYDWPDWIGPGLVEKISPFKIKCGRGESYQRCFSDKILPDSAFTPIPAGTELTLSCYFYENTVTTGKKQIFYESKPFWRAVRVPDNFVGLFTATFVAREEITRTCIDFDLRDTSEGQTWVVGPAKLERGSKATDWTPAPEDTDNRLRLASAITAETAIIANRIICGTDSGYKYIASGISFDLGYPLLYSGSSLNANTTGTNNYLSFPNAIATNNGTIESGSAKKTLYLKGTVSGNSFTIANSPFMTTVIPTTEDGYFYIPLGVMYSTTHIYFESSNRLYAFVNGSFQAVDVAGQILAIQSINRLNTLEPVVEQHSANFDVLQDSIMSNVEANYTRADEFNTYVDNQQSSLTQLSNSITAQFNESRELIGSVNGALETYKDDISKYIRFSAEGIEIGEEGNALTLKIDNDEIGFYKEGDQIAYWDGSTLYTGNAWITLERQFRIGNFAAIPRSDGSVSWLKVGE